MTMTVRLDLPLQDVSDQLQQKSLLNTGGRGIECHHLTREAVLYGLARYPAGPTFRPLRARSPSRELRKRGHLIRLQPQQFAVLLLLTERARQIHGASKPGSRLTYRPRRQVLSLDDFSAKQPIINGLRTGHPICIGNSAKARQ
jgi:hypothetical protein